MVHESMMWTQDDLFKIATKFVYILDYSEFKKDELFNKDSVCGSPLANHFKKEHSSNTPVF